MTESSIPRDAPGQHRRKLRPLVITMGSTRRDHISELFSCPSMSDHFDPPAFTPGIPSRDLRNRLGLIRTAHDAGIIPAEEWAAVSTRGVEAYSSNPERLFDCLSDVPVAPGRHGSESDRRLHYSVELWRKAKGLNRGRSVLGCALAHLIAMRRLVEGGYDLILEDNVRCPIRRLGEDPERLEDGGGGDGGDSTYCECAERIWNASEASDAAAADRQWGADECHLRYYGWLGSRTNLKWVMETHARKMAFPPEDNEDDAGGGDGDARGCGRGTMVFPFPIKGDIDENDGGEGEESHGGNMDSDDRDVAEEDGDRWKKPGGNLLWGAYAYWISAAGLNALLSALRSDVGALVWKGKRMRNHQAKPIDKTLPRRIQTAFGRGSIHVAAAPAFFRAPMLTSQIHQRWDADFCWSTEYQMSAVSFGGSSRCRTALLTWDDLWLTEDERRIVEHQKKHGTWLTAADLSKLDVEAKKP